MVVRKNGLFLPNKRSRFLLKENSPNTNHRNVLLGTNHRNVHCYLVHFLIFRFRSVDAADIVLSKMNLKSLDLSVLSD